MIGFRSPTPEFLAEMVEGNITSEKSGLDLTVVPKPVLEQVIHMLLIRTIRDQSVEKIDMSVGPNEEYHHEIQGLAITTPDGNAGIWALNSNIGRWCAVHITETPTTREVLVFRLNDDEEWELIAPYESEEAQREMGWALFTAFTYLGIVPPATDEQLGFVTED